MNAYKSGSSKARTVPLVHAGARRPQASSITLQADWAADGETGSKIKLANLVSPSVVFGCNDPSLGGDQFVVFSRQNMRW